MDVTIILIALSMAAVVVVLARGLYSFTQSGEEARRRSNRLMQWRVALQFVAVLLILLFTVIASSQ